MEIHQILRIAGGVGTLAMFIPMAMEVIKRDGAGQSFSTWFLWAALDSILSLSTIIQHGNFLLPLGYAIGGWLFTVLLLVKGKFSWNRLDNVVLALVLGCLIGWKLAGARIAIVCATLATSLATIPGLVELWRRPQRSVGNVWIGYAVTNALSCAGGTAWTIEERFTPAIFTLLSLMMFAAGRRPPSGQ
ncbi:MAG TPA: hypothetical protein VFV81_01665 [Verrucomicrobiae bacterium]|nr:hypothetical protein [Verrucomicrobiae bacterium]